MTDCPAAAFPTVEPPPGQPEIGSQNQFRYLSQQSPVGRGVFRFTLRKKKKEADRRQTRAFQQPVRKRRTGRATVEAACAAPPLRARSPAGVPLAALAGATERSRSAPVHALPGTELGRGGCYPLPAVPVQREAHLPQAGRNAGRAFWPGAAREPRLTRPKPAGTVLAPNRRRHPAASFPVRDLRSLYVSLSRTFVTSRIRD